jgi:hypothetical protein
MSFQWYKQGTGATTNPYPGGGAALDIARGEAAVAPLERYAGPVRTNFLKNIVTVVTVDAVAAADAADLQAIADTTGAIFEDLA